MDPLLRGVLTLVGVTVALSGVLGVILYAGTLRRVLRRIRERISPPPAQPQGPPLGVLVDDCRRLHCAYRYHPSGQPMARRRGIERAYDEALLDACRALGVPDTLSPLPEGTERDAERLRVEYLLERQGLVLHQHQQ